MTEIPKITARTRHQIWCETFRHQQNKTTKLIRRYINQSRIFNPFSDKTIDNLLKRYEKSFWG